MLSTKMCDIYNRPDPADASVLLIPNKRKGVYESYCPTPVFEITTALPYHTQSDDEIVTFYSTMNNKESPIKWTSMFVGANGLRAHVALV